MTKLERKNVSIPSHINVELTSGGSILYNTISDVFLRGSFFMLK